MNTFQNIISNILSNNIYLSYSLYLISIHFYVFRSIDEKDVEN